MSLLCVNWRARLRDVVDACFWLSVALALGAFFGLLVGAFVMGIIWCRFVLAAIVGAFVLWSLWLWLTQDDWEDDR